MSSPEPKTPQQDSAPPPRRRGCAWIVFFIMVVISALWGALLGAFVWILEDARGAITSLDEFRPKVGSVVYASDGEMLGEFAAEVRHIVPLSEMPLHLQKAFIATEDDSFYVHKGVRPLAILSAVKDMLRTGRVRGASTITQQLSRNIEGTGVSKEETITRKIKEAIVSFQFERHFTKDEILELYLNQIFLGIRANGVEAASRQYFAKGCRDLTIGEAATIAGLTRAPNLNDPLRNPKNALIRRNIVLGQMLDNGFITTEEHEAALAESLDDSVVTKEERAAMEATRERGLAPNQFLAPYFSEEVRLFLNDPPAPHEVSIQGSELYAEGLTIHTTVDLRLQRAAEEVLSEALDKFDAEKLEYLTKHKREREFVPVTGALICIDNRPGYEGFVRAMVGGRDFSKQQFNNATQAARQAGSSFKPFVWMAALDNNMTGSTLELDEEIVRIDGAGNEWRPRNFGDKFTGPVTLRNALAKSINIISIKLVERLGMPLVRSYIEAAGITTPIGSQVGLTIGLGTPAVKVIDQCNAYSTLAKGGLRCDPVLVTEVTDRDGGSRYNYKNFQRKRRVFPKDLTYAITSLMQGVCAIHNYENNTHPPVYGSGWRTRELKRPRAGKTGTTNLNKDAWFCGFTPQYTCVVWVGYANSRPLADEGQLGGTGGRTASPIWTDFMKRAHEGLPDKDFEPPHGVAFYYVDHATGLLGGKFREAFIRGQTPPTEMPDFGITEEDEEKLERDSLVRL